MSLLVAINGQNYIIPEPNEVGWGSNLDDFFVAISNGVLQKTGGSFTLSAETDFGTTYGLKSAYYKSRAANVAATGAIRLANAETGVVWRNFLNNADLALTVSASNQLTFNGTPVASTSLSSAHIFVGNVSNLATDVAMTGDISIDNTGLTAIGAGKIVNAQVNASAAIAYSKLALTGSIVNADVNASAAIAYSKLSLTGGIVNADISTSAAIARSKIATGTAYTLVVNSSTGALSEVAALGSSGQVLTSNGAGALPTFKDVAGTGTVNTGTANQLAYYASSTNAVSGLTLITGSRALASDSNGLPVASATTATELGYVNGVTSAIQTQLNTKAPTASPTFTGTATAPNLALTDVTNQIVLGATRTVTLTAPTPATSSRTWTFPDLTTSPTVAALEGTQTFSGTKTFSSYVTITGDNSAQANLVISEGSATNVGIEITNSTNSGSAGTWLHLNNGGTSGGDSFARFDGHAASGNSPIWGVGMDQSDDGAFVVSQGTALGASDCIRVDRTTLGAAVRGTNTSDNATAGFVGEYIESVVGFTNFPATDTWNDFTSISLTAGDWDVTVQGTASFAANTITQLRMGVSVTSGNSATGLVDGSSLYDLAIPNAAINSSGCIGGFRKSVSTTTVVYFKYRGSYSGTAPQLAGRICARRRR